MALARIAYQNGEEFTRLLIKVRELELQDYKRKVRDSGIEEVEIAGGKCEKCQADDGKVFIIEEALKVMPIPHADCECNYGGYRFAWCTCRWVVKV